MLDLRQLRSAEVDAAAVAVVPGVVAEAAVEELLAAEVSLVAEADSRVEAHEEEVSPEAEHRAVVGSRGEEVQEAREGSVDEGGVDPTFGFALISVSTLLQDLVTL